MANTSRSSQGLRGSSWNKSSLGAFPKNSLVIYTAAFLAIIAIVAIGYQPPEQTDAAASAIETTQNTTTDTPRVSVDDLYATKIAANIAETASMPVAANVAEFSQSLAAESKLARSDENIVAKPQIVKPTADSRTMRTYVAETGDTVQSVAAKYGISVSTIKWANNLQSDALEKGRQLKILPTDGVLYTVEQGDTVSSIAEKYRTSTSQVVAFNDLELSGIKNGQQLIIPEGVLPANERPGYTAPRPIYNSGSSYSGGYGSANPYLASAGNRYAFGNCTWYAFERRLQLGRPVGNFWGNASTWAMYASASGYAVNGTPAPGAVMQNGAYGYFGYGHVAIVESVDPGNSITISEMNAYRFGGGFNRIGRGTIPWNEATSGMFKYIH